MLESGIALVDIKAEIDRLYRLPLAEFVDERNRLARSLRRQDRAAAQTIKKLAKPSVSAWAVNQAYWLGREQFDALLQAGDKLRALQKQALTGALEPGAMQAAMLAQRAALGAVKKHAEAALQRDGHSAGSAILRRVSTTIEALAAYGRAPSAPHVGRLSADVPAPGFDALNALAEQTDASADARESTSDERARRSANDNRIRPGESARDAELQAQQAAAQAARARAREQATLAVTEARADVAARHRAIEAARDIEKTALDRVYAAEKAIENARLELERATATRDQALRSAEDAKQATRMTVTASTRAEVLLAEAEARLAELE